jgi:hypothetical protein
MSKPKSGKHGGRRPGAGRKPKAAPIQIAAVERSVGSLTKRQLVEELRARADGELQELLPQLYGNLLFLANGGFPRESEIWERADSIYVDGVVEDKDGNPILDANGRPTKIRVRAFPDAKPGEMILTKRSVETAEPDRESNKYLIDRALGSPTKKHEISGGATPIQIHITAEARRAAEAELAEWRRNQAAAISNLPVQPPTALGSAKNTG